MAKFRVTYVAVKHQLTFRESPKGQKELLNDQIAFREEKSVEVEAADGTTALAAVRATLPKDVDFTAEVARATSGQVQ